MTDHVRNLNTLTENTFDIVIIGGGISGAWLALHCSQAGYKTVLVEQGDFAGKTSSASSKLLHGGIRYLQQMQFNKVRESAMERAHYLHAAPHLSRAVPFIVPTYPDFKRSKFFLLAGLCAYKAVCIGENSVIGNKEQYLPPFKSLSRDALNQLCDLSNSEHNGGMVFYEYHMYDSERMVWSALRSAQQYGAKTYNYLKVDHYLTDKQRVCGVQVTDQLNQESAKIHSKLVINSAGPWIDELNNALSTAATPRIKNFALGAHIVLRNAISDHALAITTQHQSNAKVDRGGRHIFIIPWRGHSLVGTSYDETENPNKKTSIDADHVKQLLDAINNGLPNLNLTPDDVLSGYFGLYPLQTSQSNRHVYQGSGEYHIIDHAKHDGHQGIITALGAKFTTAHVLSERTMKLVHDKLSDGNTQHARTTPKLRFSNSQYESLTDFTNAKIAQYQAHFSANVIQHLVANYGSEIDRFMESIEHNQALLEPIMPSEPDILGQVYWSVKHEQAYTLNDILFRRTSVGLLGIQKKEIETIADLMASLLNWNEPTKQQQIEVSLTQIESTQQAIIDGFNEQHRHSDKQ